VHGSLEHWQELQEPMSKETPSVSESPTPTPTPTPTSAVQCRSISGSTAVRAESPSLAMYLCVYNWFGVRLIQIDRCIGDARFDSVLSEIMVEMNLNKRRTHYKSKALFRIT
jgi:hypothetical protein